MHTLLEKLQYYQDVINNSSDPEEAKTHLRYLLAVMDEIMTYPEDELRAAGMTKETMPQQKEHIEEIAPIVIEQAEKCFLAKRLIAVLQMRSNGILR